MAHKRVIEFVAYFLQSDALDCHGRKTAHLSLSALNTQVIETHVSLIVPCRIIAGRDALKLDMCVLFGQFFLA